jgi:hypothetical protein
MDYFERLLNPKWQKKRLEILSRDEWTCQKCFDSENTLNVHHMRYLKNKNPWEYPNNLLITLCKNCHEIESNNRRASIDRLIAALDHVFFYEEINDLTRAIWMIHGYKKDYTSGIIEYIFSDKSIMDDIEKKYFIHLSEKKEVI